MSSLRTRWAHVLAASFLMGAVLLLGCQPAQPVTTPKAGEKAAAATPAKPAEKAAEKPVRGGTLRAIHPGEIAATQDPHGVTSDYAPALVADLLIEEGDEFKNLTKEGLFTDWTFSNDGKAITFKLRGGVKFHDGTELDAEAVKFNVERVKDPATKAPYASNYAAVVSVEVLDSATVRFNLKAPDALLLPALVQTQARMVSPTAVKKYGQDFGRNPVGSGPFQFVEWVSGDHITVKKFEAYWRKDKEGNPLPYLDQVVFRIMTDQTAAVASLRTGQVDFYGGAPGFPQAQLPLLKADPNLTYVARLQAYTNGVYLNNKRPPFANKALRQAVALAVDREGIAGILGEGGVALASILHPMTWAYDGKAGVLPARDLAKAKAKMAEAGYPGGGLKVTFTSGNTTDNIRQAEIVKANLAEIGVDAEIEVLASAAYATKVRNERTYQIALQSGGAGLADPAGIFNLAFQSQGTRNYYNYSNPKVDELLDKAGAIYDQKERTVLYQEVANMIADDAPFIPIFAGNSLAGMNKKVRGFRLHPVPNRFVAFREVWLAQHAPQ